MKTCSLSEGRRIIFGSGSGLKLPWRLGEVVSKRSGMEEDIDDLRSSLCRRLRGELPGSVCVSDGGGVGRGARVCGRLGMGCMVGVDTRGGSSGLEYREKVERVIEEVRECDGSKVPNCRSSTGDGSVGCRSCRGLRSRGGGAISSEDDRRRLGGGWRAGSAGVKSVGLCT